MKYIGILAVILLVGIDQLTKYWADLFLKGQNDIYLWPGVFHLSYVENRGAAFGMLQGRQMLFVIVTCIIIGVILWYWKSIPKNKWGQWMKVAFILIISGAIGNLIDRVALDYVRDMLYFVLIDFPVFNVADICVVIGVMLLFPLLLILEDEEKKMKDQTIEEKK